MFSGLNGIGGNVVVWLAVLRLWTLPMLATGSIIGATDNGSRADPQRRKRRSVVRVGISWIDPAFPSGSINGSNYLQMTEIGAMSGPLTAGDFLSDFTLTAADGREYSSSDARRRGLLLFAIYKAGCGTCQYTMPFLQRFHDQYTSDRFRIWGVSQENEEDTIAFADRFSATFPQILDSSLAVSRDYGLTHVPGIYLVDETDRILRHAPAFDSNELNAMSRLIAERTGTPYAPIVRPEDNAPPFKPG